MPRRGTLVAFSRDGPPYPHRPSGNTRALLTTRPPSQCLVQGEGGTLGNPLGDGSVRPNLRVRIRGAGGRRSCMLGKTVEMLASMRVCRAMYVCSVCISLPTTSAIRAHVSCRIGACARPRPRVSVRRAGSFQRLTTINNQSHRYRHPRFRDVAGESPQSMAETLR